MSARKSLEYFRGCYHGYASAMEVLAKYGQAFVQNSSQQLDANLRKRGEEHTDFDYGYSHAFRAVAYTHVSQLDMAKHRPLVDLPLGLKA